MGRKIEAIGALRGLGAFYVVARHITFLYAVPFHPLVAALLAPLRYGPPGHVVFFVLSGFGLTMSLDRQTEAGTATSLLHFWTAQWRRIIPPYYATLLLCYTVPGLAILDSRLRVQAAHHEPYQVIAHLSLLHGLSPVTMFGVSPPLWSMSLIFQFYLVFPLLYALMRRADYRLVLVAVVASWAVLRVSLKILALGEQSPAYQVNIVCHITPFVAGMAVAHWYRGVRDGKADGFPRLTAAAAVVLLGLSYLVGVFKGGAESELIRSAGFGALLMCVLGSCGSGGVLGRLLSGRALAGLGSISYGLYLTHDLVLSRLCVAYRFLVPHPGPVTDALLVVTGMAMTVCFAWVFHRALGRATQAAHQARLHVADPRERLPRRVFWLPAR